MKINFSAIQTEMVSDTISGDESFAKKYYAIGTEKLNGGDNHGAISEFKAAINLDLNLLEAYNDTAITFLKLENYNMSLYYFDLALKIKPDFDLTKKNKAVVYYYRGTKKHDLKQYKEAIIDYTEAIHLYPGYFEAYNDRGAVFSQIRKYKKAISDYNIALQINPNYDRAQINQSNLKSFQNKQAGRTFNALKAISTSVNALSSSFNANNKTNLMSSSTNTASVQIIDIKKHLEKVTCLRCNGTGVDPIITTVAEYGSTDQKWSEESKKWVSYSLATHQRCPICRGKGYTEKYGP